MTPVLVTLYGDGGPGYGSRVALGGGRGAAVDLSQSGGDSLGFDFGALFSAIGKGVSSIVQTGSKARGEREKANREAEARARLALIAAQKRKMILYVVLGGGVLAVGAGAFLLTRKKKRR